MDILTCGEPTHQVYNPQIELRLSNFRHGTPFQSLIVVSHQCPLVPHRRYNDEAPSKAWSKTPSVWFSEGCAIKPDGIRLCPIKAVQWGNLSKLLCSQTRQFVASQLTTLNCYGYCGGFVRMLRKPTLLQFHYISLVPNSVSTLPLHRIIPLTLSFFSTVCKGKVLSGLRQLCLRLFSCLLW